LALLSSVRGTLVALALLGVFVPGAVGAQSLFERLNLDRLRLTGLGFTVGPVRASRADDTQSFGVYADYGYVTPSWRVVFSATYWGSHFRDEFVETLEARLREHIIDPSGDDTLDLGRVNVSDIALEVDLRYTPRPNAALRPYAGGGVGAHMINAESPFINDTFVESALDNISAGLAAFAGIDTAPAGRFSFGLQARVNLLSNLRYWSGRALVTYFFGNQPPSSPP
jgi:opacity protein-like surface antigen